eukprot:1158238-Pelagomonas_calceolata.AAC.1
MAARKGPAGTPLLVRWLLLPLEGSCMAALAAVAAPAATASLLLLLPLPLWRTSSAPALAPAIPAPSLGLSSSPPAASPGFVCTEGATQGPEHEIMLRLNIAGDGSTQQEHQQGSHYQPGRLWQSGLVGHPWQVKNIAAYCSKSTNRDPTTSQAICGTS